MKLIWISHEAQCPQSEFQNLLFCVLRRRPCCCWYFSIVLVLLCVPITVSTHLCVICCHFYCPVLLLFQGHVACRNFTLTRPQSCAPGSVSILENYPPTPLQLTQLTQHFAFSETLVLAFGLGEGWVACWKEARSQLF